MSEWEYTGEKFAEAPKLIATLPPDNWVLAMQVFDGQLILATSRGVYRLAGEEFKEIPLVSP